MKRAALIVTPSRRIKWTTYTQDGWKDDIDLWCETDPQLLADLRLAVDALMYASGDEGYPMVVDPEGCRSAAARVRALLPDDVELLERFAGGDS